MSQIGLFDAKKGEQLKDEGMDKAACNRDFDLAIARNTAVMIAQGRQDRSCTADDVQRVLIERGISLGNAAGSIFRGKRWRFTGRFVKSQRVSNHASIRRVWQLVD